MFSMSINDCWIILKENTCIYNLEQKKENLLRRKYMWLGILLEPRELSSRNTVEGLELATINIEVVWTFKRLF